MPNMPQGRTSPGLPYVPNKQAVNRFILQSLRDQIASRKIVNFASHKIVGGRVMQL